MTLDDLAKPNFLTLAGLGLLSAALPAVAPQLRPAMKSVVRFGVSLFAEAASEAESELIEALVADTLRQIADALSHPGGESERRAAVRESVHGFRRRARKHAGRWSGDEAERARRYRRYTARLESRLAQRKLAASPGERDVIEDAFIALADPP